MKSKMKLTGKRGAVGIVATALLVAGYGNAVAGDNKGPRFTVSAISDTAQGQKVLSNKFDRAIAKLETSKTDGIRGFYVATNLCVSYLKTGEYDIAKDSCDGAVDAINKEIDNLDRFSLTAKREAYERFLSIALSNRGVAYALNGDEELAREDFEAALEIRSGAREPKVNLARLAEVTASSA